MNWDDVRVFLALLRSANLHDASARLGIDRSTISRRLCAMEDSLRTPLFVRSREGMKPTAAAERLRPHAERMEQEAHSLTERALAVEVRATGVVRVATTEAFASFLVAQGLLSLRDEHPDLMIELLGGNSPLDLTRGEADLAVRVSPLRHASLRVKCLARLGFGAFASPAYLKLRGVPRTAEALSGHDLLLPGGELENLPEAKWLRSQSGTRVVFRSNSLPALVAAAVAGHGIAPLTLPWGDRESGLQRLMTLDEVPARPVWRVTHAASDRHAVKVVSERIARIFAQAMSRGL